MTLKTVLPPAAFGIAALALCGGAVYLGIASVNTLSIPTARDWVLRHPSLPVAADAPAPAEKLDLTDVRDGKAAIPNVVPAHLPDALATLEDTERRKDLFIKSVLPMVLQVNDLIRRDRERAVALKGRIGAGLPMSPADERWLRALMAEYRLQEFNIDRLLRRLDIIPPSLALAQAAIESAWGRSRFAQNGNALFGQWTWDEQGMVPQERPDGEKYRVRRFETPLASVYAYMRNLNTHPSYQAFRAKRAELRRQGRQRDGYALAATLERYSTRGAAYIEELRQIMRANRLTEFDAAMIGSEATKLASRK